MPLIPQSNIVHNVNSCLLEKYRRESYNRRSSFNKPVSMTLQYLPAATKVLKRCLFLLAAFVFTHLTAFQTLGPYYIKQHNDASCSLATATMLLNASLVLSQPLSQEELLAKVNQSCWAQAIATHDSSGITLEAFSILLSEVFHSFGLNDVCITTVHVSTIDVDSRERLRSFLRLIGRGQVLVVANFDQSLLVPANGPAGHFSPIGDYDSASGNVWLLDTDRELAGPYWVSEEKLIQSMHTIDQDAQPPQFRGYLVINKHIDRKDE